MAIENMVDIDPGMRNFGPGEIWRIYQLLTGKSEESEESTPTPVNKEMGETSARTSITPESLYAEIEKRLAQQSGGEAPVNPEIAQVLTSGGEGGGGGAPQVGGEPPPVTPPTKSMWGSFSNTMEGSKQEDTATKAARTRGLLGLKPELPVGRELFSKDTFPLKIGFDASTQPPPNLDLPPLPAQPPSPPTIKKPVIPGTSKAEVSPRNVIDLLTPKATTTPPTITETNLTEPTEPKQVDFKNLISPWKPKVDYEKELIQAYNELLPLYSELPKSKYRPPSDKPGDQVVDIFRGMLMSMGGIDPHKFEQEKKLYLDKEADKERNYYITRATNMFNAKVQLITKKMEKEDAEREKTVLWMQWLGNSDPSYKKSPEFVSAYASIMGVDPKLGDALLQSKVDPKTGRLEGMWTSPVEQAIAERRALQKSIAEDYEKTGMSKEDAWMRALPGGAEQAKTKETMAFAKNFLLNFNDIKKTGVFGDDASANYVKMWASLVVALGPESMGKISIPTVKEHNINLKESMVKAALSVKTPQEEDAFVKLTKGLTSGKVIEMWMGDKGKDTPDPSAPDPYYTNNKWYGKNAKDFAIDPANNLKVRNHVMANEFPELFRGVMSGAGITDPDEKAKWIKSLQKKPLEDTEVFSLSTAARIANTTGDASAIIMAYQQMRNNRLR